MKTLSWGNDDGGGLSLVLRLVLMAAFAILLGGAALLYATVTNMANSYHTDLSEQLNDGLDSLVISLGEQAVLGDYATIQQILNSRVKRRNTATVSWIDTTGKTIVAPAQSGRYHGASHGGGDQAAGGDHARKV